jgi:hypothetical protein
MLSNTEFLQGGIQDFRKTLGVQAVAANPNSCHPWWVVVARKARRGVGFKGKWLSELGFTE